MLLSLKTAMTETSRILSCSTHYSVLKLEQRNHALVFVDAPYVRKSYKELAILVHPDKNRASGMTVSSRGSKCMVLLF